MMFMKERDVDLKNTYFPLTYFGKSAFLPGFSRDKNPKRLQQRGLKEQNPDYQLG